MKLFYRKSGKGPALVILHGLYGSSDNWVTFSKRLEDRFTVYLPDLRNHGRSPHDIVHDYDSMANDIFELVKELNTGKIFLAGHSMGGKTATTFALKWPELVSGLLIADVSPFQNGTRQEAIFKKHIAILDAIQSFDLSAITTRQEADSILAKKNIEEKERGLILKNLHRKSASEFEWKMNVAGLNVNIGKIMEEINPSIALNRPVTGFPVIFLKAEDSDYLLTSDFNSIKIVFPAAEFATIAGASHWIQADRPAEVEFYIKKLLE
jgi:esterase